MFAAPVNEMGPAQIVAKHPEKATNRVPEAVQREAENNCKAEETTRWLPLYGIAFSLLALALFAAWDRWRRRRNGAQGNAGASTAPSSA
ncbi:hypothetical protein GCM10023086_06300 [Streptomyces venetus]|uniref:Uncharacterized protein n=1 Tax=Streptomyces venetus TaxID=1701086 RepID=A0ABP8F3P3_9ACTN